MKSYLVGFGLLVIFSFVACEKENLDTPGSISGMGDKIGDLDVKQSYELPKGINLVGEITGIKAPIGKSGDMLNSLGDTKADYSIYGSGGVVRLKISLFNYRNYPLTVFFPKGLLWKCKTGSFQEGLQAQTTWVCIPANSLRTIFIDLYCLNLHLPAPNQTGTYSILGVTNSQTIWKLLNLIGWRRINFEMIYHHKGKGLEEEPTYEVIVERLQTIVHNLTDRGLNITADDKAFIESIPELSSSEIPPLDVNLQYPEYFDEFVVPEN